jgi:hypothetical protein
MSLNQPLLLSSPLYTKCSSTQRLIHTDISNNVCGVKAFFERRTARTPRSCFDSALVEELIIDDEGSHVICRAELGPTQTSLRSHVRP